MDEETMRKHYERTPKDNLISILISSRKEFNKLQNRNKECKQEIERLNNIINELENDLYDRYYARGKYHMDSGVIGIKDILDKSQELKGSDKE